MIYSGSSLISSKVEIDRPISSIGDLQLNVVSSNSINVSSTFSNAEDDLSIRWREFSRPAYLLAPLQGRALATWGGPSFNEACSGGVLTMTSVGASAAQSTAGLWVKMIDNSSTEPTNWMMEALGLMIQTTSNIYRDALETCKSILLSVDIDDDESRERASTRLSDVLMPFQTVLTSIFGGLIMWQRDDADLIAFLLNEIMMRQTSIEADARLEIIRTALESSQASVRLAAIEALDRLGTDPARKIMSDIYPNESRLGRDLIFASLNNAYA